MSALSRAVTVIIFSALDKLIFGIDQIEPLNEAVPLPPLLLLQLISFTPPPSSSDTIPDKFNLLFVVVKLNSKVGLVMVKRGAVASKFIDTLEGSETFPAPSLNQA